MGGQLVQSRVWKQERATITVNTKRKWTIKYLIQYNLGHSDFLEPWVANVWEENGPVVRCKGSTKKPNYIVIFIQYRARGDCHIWHSDNVPAGGADPGLLYDGAPRAESQEEGDGDA